MRKAVVTGASSGIGNAIAQRLLQLGYSVIGVSRNISPSSIQNENFHAIKTDLSSQKELQSLCDKLKKEKIFLLIHSAGFGVFQPHEELSPQTIIDMTYVNLTAPMLLTNALLRELKEQNGYLININSIEALRSSKFSGVYSATKTGLKAFGDALFEETRKSGLSITNINPDMTESSFYDSLQFSTSQKEDEKLFASDIADAVEHILTMRKGAVVSEYTVRSLKFAIVKKKL